MTRILAYTTPARGHLYPVVPILTTLRDRGADVTLRTVADDVEAMQHLGFDVAPVAPTVSGITLQDWRARSASAALRKAVQTFAARAPFEAADLDAAIERSRPDCLLVDVNAWGAIAAAERSGLPWAIYSPYPLTLRSNDAPPFGPGLPPARGPLGRARDRLLAPLVLGAMDHILVPPTNELRRSMGLRPLRRHDDMLRQAPLLLSLTAEPFEYHRRDWPDNVVLVGPCEWEAPATPPEWLDEVDRPIVLVTTSSEFQDDLRLVQVAVDALGSAGYFVVATLPAASPDGVQPAAHCRVERFLPHGLVLDRAVCAVTHGGMGATQKALAHGVPVVAVPFGRDQYEVARRVESCGAGVRLPSSRLTGERLTAAVARAVRRQPVAAAVASAFRRAGGATAAADAVQARLFAATVTGTAAPATTPLSRT